MKNLRSLRIEKQKSQQEIADFLNISNQAYSNYENGRREPDFDTLGRLSDYFNVSIDYLLGRTENAMNYIDAPAPTSNGSRWVPVYGNIAGGTPIEMITDIEDWEEIDESTANRGEIFALRVRGDSMEPKISDGDVVIIKKQNDVDNGEIAAVAVNGDCATLKRVKKTPQGIMLVATNPKYEPLFFTNEEIELTPIRIIGKMIELRAKF